MAGQFTQKKGSFQMSVGGGAYVEYGGAITKAKPVPARDTVDLPATLLTGSKDRELGPSNDMIEVGWLCALAASGLRAAMRNAEKNYDGEAAIKVVLNGDVAVSADNPRFVGTIIIDQVPTGADVGSLRQESGTFAYKAGTYDELAV